MATAPKATLGPATLDLSRPVTWTLRTGVAPSIEIFEFDKDEAAKIAGTQGALTLTITANDGKTLTVGDLYVVGEMASQDPNRRALVIADLRIWWRRKRCFARFNIRRRTGDLRRLNADGSLPNQVAPVVDDLTYALWSTKDGSGAAFTGADLLKVITDQIALGDIFEGALGAFPARAVDHVEIDESGDRGIRAAMSMIPGCEMFVDTRGIVKFFDRTDMGALAKALTAWGAEVVGTPHVAFAKIPQQRPESIRVLFTVEQEVRFDAIEDGDYGFSKDMRGMRCVCPIPDPTLTLGNGRVVVQGTYVPFAEVLPAWSANAGGGAALTITDQDIKDGWLSPGFDATYAGLGSINPDAIWMDRIGAVRAHYRQTWRIERRWMDRIFSMRPYRVSIWDTETGTFAPAVAYAGYAFMPSTKGLLADEFKQNMILNGSGSISKDQKLSEGRPAPCRVVIIDEEQGLIRLDYQVDLLKNYRTIIPSAVKNVPTCNLADRLKPITMDGSVRGDAGIFPALADSNRVAVVLTVAPAAPNGKAQLYGINVTLAQALGYLSKQAAAALTPSIGPVWELRVGPALATARFAWDDDRAEEIERSFGVGLSLTDDQTGNRLPIAELLQNRKEMRDLAEVLAAQMYSTLLDRYQGALTIPLQPDAVPVGPVETVTHTLTTEGFATTTIAMPPELTPVDAMALLPTSARRLFLRTVQP